MLQGPFLFSVATAGLPFLPGNPLFQAVELLIEPVDFPGESAQFPVELVGFVFQPVYAGI